MYYLIPIPIIFVAAMVKLVASNYKLKSFEIIANIAIIISVIFFIYYFTDHLGYNLINIVKNFFLI